MIKLKIDVTKIDKSRLFKGSKGTYLDLVVYENDKPDEYGNDYSVKQDCSKDDRDNGVKMPYIGNGKNIGQKKQAAATRPASQQRPPARPAPSEDFGEGPITDGLDGDDIPF